MLVAIPEIQGRIAEHFGRTRHFVIAKIASGRVVSKTYVKVPPACQGKQQFVRFLKANRVGQLIVQAIGSHALAFLREGKIKVVQGAEGDIDSVLMAFSCGTLNHRPTPCHLGRSGSIGRN